MYKCFLLGVRLRVGFVQWFPFLPIQRGTLVVVLMEQLTVLLVGCTLNRITKQATFNYGFWHSLTAKPMTHTSRALWLGAILNLHLRNNKQGCWLAAGPRSAADAGCRVSPFPVRIKTGSDWSQDAPSVCWLTCGWDMQHSLTHTHTRCDQVRLLLTWHPCLERCRDQVPGWNRDLQATETTSEDSDVWTVQVQMGFPN